MDALDLTVWRHPKPVGAAGRCIGRCDLPVDRRKAKRLAHRVRAHARRTGAARRVWTSTLRRGADVGRWLARWGWRWTMDERLAELDFGAWDGRRWGEIGADELARWTDDFASHAPGGGESLLALIVRCREFLDDVRGGCVIGHAGWISAARFVHEGRAAPRDAADWPAPIGYGAGVSFRSNSGGAESQ